MMSNKQEQQQPPPSSQQDQEVEAGDDGVNLTASQINNVGVEWFRAGELTTAFQFFYHAIERFKAGRAAAAPPPVESSSSSSCDSSSEEDCDGTSTIEDVNMADASAENRDSSDASQPPLPPSTPRTRLEGIFANSLLFQEQAYRCPFRIAHSTESKLYYFSQDATQDYILCSCISVCNMAITVHAMDDATAAANHIHDRHQKVQGLFAHCLQLLSLVLDPMPLPTSPLQQQQQSLEDPSRASMDQQKNVVLTLSNRSGSTSISSSCSVAAPTINSVTLATCDLLGMACLNNLIVMTVDSELPTECPPSRNLHLETLLRTVTTIRADRYGDDSDLMAVMARMADMFLITVFFLLKFPPGPGAAAA